MGWVKDLGRSIDRNFNPTRDTSQFRKAGRFIDRMGHDVFGAVVGAFGAPFDMLANIMGWGDPPATPPNPLITKFGSTNKLPVIYGQQRVAGVIVYEGASGDNNKYLHVVYALCEGEIESIDEIWLDDIKSTDSRWGDKVYIPADPATSRTRYGWVGTDPQTAPAVLISAMPADWSSSDKGTGVAYIYARFEYDENIFQGGQPPKLLADVRGKRVYDPRDTTTKYSTNNALCTYDHLTNAIHGRGLASSKIDSTSFEDGADNCDTAQNPRTSLPTGYLVNQTDHAAGDYSVTVDTGSNAPIKGDTFTMPSDTTVYFIIGISGSAPDYTLTHIPAARTTFANNAALDFQIPYYEVGGMLDMERSTFFNTKLMLQSFQAMLPYYGGQYHLKMRDFDNTPVFTIDSDTIIGGVSYSKEGKDYRKNKIVAKFGNPDKRWNLDIVIQESSTYQSEDNGLILEATIDMPLENNPYRALFRAGVALNVSRDDLTFSLVGPMALLQIETGDVVNLTYNSAGISAKAFLVVQMVIMTSVGLVGCQLQEYNSTSYSRTTPPGYTSQDDTNLPSHFDSVVNRTTSKLMVSNWYERTNPVGVLTGIAAGNGVIVGVGDYSGGDVDIILSSNGINYVEQTNSGATKLRTVIFDGTNFIAAGDNDGATGDCLLMISADGASWTEYSTPMVPSPYSGSASIRSIAYDGYSKYIAFGTSDWGSFWMSSTNGTSWTLEGWDGTSDFGFSAAINNVRYLNGQFVAVGGDSDTIVAVSSDGSTWTEVSYIPYASSGQQLIDVAFGNGIYVAVGVNDGTDAFIYTSEDLITWAERTNPKDIGLVSIIFAEGVFVAFGGYSSTDTYALTSINGKDWEERKVPTQYYTTALAYSGDMRVFIASVGSGKLLTSLFGK